MNNIKIGAASLNQIPLDWNGNFDRICAVIKEAYEQGVTLLLLPELCITGYSCEDAFFIQDVQKKSKKMLFNIVEFINAINDDIVVSVGLPYFFDGAIYNVAAIINKLGLIALIPKQNLANDGVHYESRWFKPWESEKLSYITEYGIKIPFGDLLIDFNGVKIGYEVCQDSWVSNRPGINHAQHGVDIILNPSASHFAFGKHDIRERFIKEGSRAFKCAYVYANLLGNEAGSSIFEGDTFIAAGGEVVASGRRLSFKDHILTTAIIDTDYIKTIQSMDGSYRPDVGEYNKVEAKYDLKNHSYENQYGLCKAEKWCKEEEFVHAESLALFDYLRKSHSKSYILSLSGGADSTACAILIKFMHDFGVEELGLDNFIEKSGISFSNKENLMSDLLTCIYQGTENSSKETLESAETVAKAINATFINWSVDNVINEYKSLVQVGLNVDLTWEADDIALQNIQARARIPALWMIANIKNGLLICTSNRSEAAVGYSTADGDLSGSLLPIGGVSKQFLLHWLWWVQYEYAPKLRRRNFKKEVEWIDCLAGVNSLKPSAELRPLSTNQNDEQDLMPYDVLEFIEHKFIVEKKSPTEVFECVKNRYSGSISCKICPELNDTPEKKLELYRGYVNKFFKLWSRNQWKRHKMSVSFMLDDECLDPKTFCRFPILSVPFEEV